MEGWEGNTIDIKLTYLQGHRIKRKLYVTRRKEAKKWEWYGSWKKLYELKDVARALDDRVVDTVVELGGKKGI